MRSASTFHMEFPSQISTTNCDEQSDPESPSLGFADLAWPHGPCTVEWYQQLTQDFDRKPRRVEEAIGTADSAFEETCRDRAYSDMSSDIDPHGSTAGFLWLHSGIDPHGECIRDEKADVTSPTWYRQMMLDTEEQRQKTRMEDLEAVERRAKKQAAENAIAGKRLQRREAEVSAVEERAKKTMAELAKQQLQVRRKEVELKNREDLTLAREAEVRRNARRALEAHAAVAEKEKRFGIRVHNLQREAVEDLRQEEAQVEHEKRCQLLMERIRLLEQQKEAMREELVENLGEPGVYLNRLRNQLDDREGKLGIQVALHRQEVMDWEEQLHAERSELGRLQTNAKKKLRMLFSVTESLLADKYMVVLVERVFHAWKALSMEAMVQQRFGQFKPAADNITNTKHKTWDEECEQRQELRSLLWTLQRSIFFVWRGIVLNRVRSEQSSDRLMRSNREEFPVGVAWDVKGWQIRKWEVGSKYQGLFNSRQNTRDQNALHTAFFSWKHMLRDPRRISLQIAKDYVRPAQEFEKSIAWSVDLTDSSSVPSPRQPHHRGKPFSWSQRPEKTKLRVINVIPAYLDPELQANSRQCHEIEVMPQQEGDASSLHKHNAQEHGQNHAVAALQANSRQGHEIEVMPQQKGDTSSLQKHNAQEPGQNHAKAAGDMRNETMPLTPEGTPSIPDKAAHGTHNPGANHTGDATALNGIVRSDDGRTVQQQFKTDDSISASRSTLGDRTADTGDVWVNKVASNRQKLRASLLQSQAGPEGQTTIGPDALSQSLLESLVGSQTADTGEWNERVFWNRQRLRASLSKS